MAETTNGMKNPELNAKDFTKTQRNILDVLADGMPHSTKELKKCLWDELSGDDTIYVHISNIRKVLRPLGQDIVCEFKDSRYFYRHIRLIASPYDGRS